MKSSNFSGYGYRPRLGYNKFLRCKNTRSWFESNGNVSIQIFSMIPNATKIAMNLDENDSHLQYKISNGSISLIENFIILHFLTHLTFSLCVASIYKFLILEIKMPKLYACIIWHQNAKLQRGERRKRCYNSAPQRSSYPERIFDRGGNRVSRDSMLRNIVERIVLTEEKQRGREYRVFLAAYRPRMDHSSVHP